MAQPAIPLFPTPPGAFVPGVHRNSFGQPQVGRHGNVFYPIHTVFTRAFIAAKLAQRHIQRVPQHLRLPSRNLCYTFGINGWCSLTSYINRGFIPWPYLPLTEDKSKIVGSQKGVQQHICTCPVDNIEKSTLCCTKDVSNARDMFWKGWMDQCVQVKTKESTSILLNKLIALHNEIEEKVRHSNTHLLVLTSHTLTSPHITYTY